MNSSSRTRDAEPVDLQTAFSNVIAIARYLKPQGETGEVGRRYGFEAGRVLRAAGLSECEALDYARRIWRLVRTEARA